MSLIAMLGVCVTIMYVWNRAKGHARRMVSIAMDKFVDGGLLLNMGSVRLCAWTRLRGAHSR
jgi:hypothetical protein